MFKEHKIFEEERPNSTIKSSEDFFKKETISEKETKSKNENENENVVAVKIGRVSKCFKLNLRKEPNANSPIVGILDRGTGVTVYTSFDNDKFYKVKTFSGEVIEGYCLKEYIDI